jgi:hypothetical protein
MPGLLAYPFPNLSSPASLPLTKVDQKNNIFPAFFCTEGLDKNPVESRQFNKLQMFQGRDVRRIFGNKPLIRPKNYLRFHFGFLVMN